MQATANPLRRPKPPRDQCILGGRFYFTDENGKLASSLGTQVYLTAECLWIAAELSISLDMIESLQIVEKRGLPPRRFLEIRFVNPITSDRETVCLCKPDPIGIGLYRVRPLQDLQRRIDDLRRASPASAGLGVAADAVLEPPPADRCEACGTKPAYYVSYSFLVSAILLSYRSADRRRIHCRMHNAIHGFAYYLLTVATGWIGIGILAYPFAVFMAGRNLAPSLGRASYGLGVLPLIGWASLVLYWLV